jgi:hypothetical protein
VAKATPRAPDGNVSVSGLADMSGISRNIIYVLLRRARATSRETGQWPTDGIPRPCTDTDQRPTRWRTTDVAEWSAKKRSTQGRLPELYDPVWLASHYLDQDAFAAWMGARSEPVPDVPGECGLGWSMYRIAQHLAGRYGSCSPDTVRVRLAAAGVPVPEDVRGKLAGVSLAELELVLAREGTLVGAAREFGVSGMTFRGALRVKRLAGG